MTNTHIEEVGLRFKADGSADYVATLKEINSAMGQLYAEYTRDNAMLDKNATATEKLTIRKQYLEGAIDEQKKKVAVLTDELGKMTAAEEKDEAAIAKKKKELTLTEAKLASYEKSLGEVGAELKNHSEWTDKASAKLKEFGEKTEAAGRKMMSVSKSIVGLGTDAVKMAADFEEAMSNVKAISGATEDQMIELSEKAREMGAKTKFSASEAAEAFTYMAMAGWEVESMLDGIEGVMLLAAASGEELALTSDIVTDALTAFGLKAEDTEHFVNVLAKASNSANTNVSMLGESFKYVAPVAGSLGFSIEDTAIALGLMANSGIKASQSGTQLRQSFANLVNPTDSMVGVMKRYNVNVTNSDGSMKSLIEIMQLMRSSFATMTEEQQKATVAQMMGIDVDKEAAEVMKTLTNEELLAELAAEAGMDAVKNLTEAELDHILALRWSEEGIGDLTFEQKQWQAACMEGQSAVEGLTQAEQASAAATLFGTRAMSGWLAIINSTDEDFDKLTESIYNSEGAVREMADIQMDNLNGQITVLKSMVEELAIGFGEILLPIVRQVVEWLQNLAQKFIDLDESTKTTILVIAAIVAALGPLLIFIGKISSAIGSMIALWPKLKAGFEAAKLALDGFTLSPATVVILAIVAAVAVLSLAFAALTADTRKAKDEVNNFAKDVPSLSKALDGIKPSLINVNDLISSTGKTMSELSSKIDETESAITKVLAAALSEQRALRQEDVESIRHYMDELLALQAEKLEMYREQQLSELRKLQLEEETLTKEGALQRISNAEEALRQTNAIVEDAYTAQLAIIENKYKAMGQIGSDAHLAEQQAAKQHYDQSLAENKTYYTQALAVATNGAAKWVAADADKWTELNNGQKKSAKQYAAILSEVDQENTKMFLQMVATTKSMGGELSEESKQNASMILSAYTDANLPKKLRDEGKNALMGMLEGMEGQIPGLENAADMTADQIVNTIKSVLQIQSPSRVLYSVGQQAVEGIEGGLNSKKSSVGKESKSIGSSLVEGIWAGINGMASWLSNKISGFVGGVVDVIKNLFGIHSPSTVMRDEIGTPLVQGIAKGIASGGALIKKAMAAISPNIGMLGELTPMMATGGQLLEGMAIVAEAGPELIQQKGGRTIVTPLTGSAKNNPLSSIDLSADSIRALVAAIRDGLRGGQESASPAIIRLVLPDGAVLAEYFIDDFLAAMAGRQQQIETANGAW